MRLYLFHCEDAAGAPALREAHLAAHLDHVEAHIGDYAVAGPLKEGGVPVGSVLIVKGADEAEARARFEADPYFRAGVWDTVRVHEFAAVAGDWVGGAAWKRRQL